jgi:hypothetical protein
VTIKIKHRSPCFEIFDRFPHFSPPSTTSLAAGNQWYLGVIDVKAEAYSCCRSRAEKGYFLEELCLFIKGKGRRFMEQTEDGSWQEVDFRRAREKVRTRLCSACPGVVRVQRDITDTEWQVPPMETSVEEPVTADTEWQVPPMETSVEEPVTAFISSLQEGQRERFAAILGGLRQNDLSRLSAYQFQNWIDNFHPLHNEAAMALASDGSTPPPFDLVQEAWRLNVRNSTEAYLSWRLANGCSNPSSDWMMVEKEKENMEAPIEMAMEPSASSSAWLMAEEDQESGAAGVLRQPQDNRQDNQDEDDPLFTEIMMDGPSFPDLMDDDSILWEGHFQVHFDDNVCV